MIFINEDIPENKFADIEVYNNGIKISVITDNLGNNMYKAIDIYLKLEDIDQIVDMCSDIISPTTDDNGSDTIEDAVW